MLSLFHNGNFLEWMEAFKIESMITVLEIVVRASLVRKESRGAMYRVDCPDTDNIA